MFAKKETKAKKVGNKVKPKASPKKASKKPVGQRTSSTDGVPIFTQFKNKPIEAIQYLMKVQKGIAKDALYRKDVGYVSITWGNGGYGLKHIIRKHGWEFERSGLPIGSSLKLVFENGVIKPSKRTDRITIEGSNTRVVVQTKKEGCLLNLVVTAFLIVKPGLPLA